MFYIYNLILLISIPFVIILYLPFFLSREKHRKNFFLRLKGPPAQASNRGNRGPKIWIHAVSVGEVIAALPLIRGIREFSPESELYLSTITITGHSIARKKASPLVNMIFYLPFDIYPLMKKSLSTLSPDLVLIMETEIWPNLIEAAKRGGAKVAIVNGRISDSSFPRYRLARFFLRGLFEKIDLFMMQSAGDVEKISSLGAEKSRIKLMKNLKYDLKTTDNRELIDLTNRIKNLASKRPVIVIGSTHEGEEDLLLDSIPLKERDLFIVLAPRHPERFDHVTERSMSRGFSVIRRSRLGQMVQEGKKVEILILDTIGELSSIYRAADMVIVGGSFVKRGGHNVLEPAGYGAPVITGPYYSNFSEIVEEMSNNEAIAIAESGDDLQELVNRLLDDRKERDKISINAKNLVEGFRGLGDKVARDLFHLLQPGK